MGVYLVAALGDKGFGRRIQFVEWSMATEASFFIYRGVYGSRFGYRSAHAGCRRQNADQQ